MDELFNEILQEIKQMPEYQEAITQEKYFELIDTVIEDKIDSGIIPDDYDVESLRSKLRAEWEDIQEKG